LKNIYRNVSININKMIARKKNQMYTSKREMIHGKGYVNTYIYENKDLISKPMPGALTLKEVSKQVLKNLKEERHTPVLKFQGILNDMISGRGIKKF